MWTRAKGKKRLATSCERAYLRPLVPEPSSKGRKASRLMTGQKSVSVEEFVKSYYTEHWRVHYVRETTRGSLKLRVLRKSVYVWGNQSEQARRYTPNATRRANLEFT
jgi:hypothetical protein